MPTAQEDLVNRLFLAIEQNDMATVEALYSDKFKIWHSFDNKYKNKIENIAMLSNACAYVSLKYQVIERVTAGNRVIQRHELIVASGDGTTKGRFNAVAFLTISNNQIVEIEEYIDSPDAQTLMATIEAAYATKA